MSEIREDRTHLEKAVYNDDWVIKKDGQILKVVLLDTNIVFKVKKNIAKLEDDTQFVNVPQGLENIGTKWEPEVDKWIVINKSQDSFDVRRVKKVDLKRRKVTTYDDFTYDIRIVEPYRPNKLPFGIR